MTRQLPTVAAGLVLALSLAGPALAQNAAPDAKSDQKKSGPAKAFARFDANNDGDVTADEIKQRQLKVFKRADANSDGVIDADEVKALGEKASKKNPKAADSVARKFKKLDTDGDGKVSETEATTPPGWFAKADANEDKKVTTAEFEALMEKRKAKGKGEGKGAKKDDAAAAPAAKDDGGVEDDGDNDDE